MHLHWTAMSCNESLSTGYVLKPGKLILCKPDPFPAPCFITSLTLCLFFFLILKAALAVTMFSFLVFFLLLHIFHKQPPTEFSTAGSWSLSVLLCVVQNDPAAARQQREQQKGFQSQHCMNRTCKCTFDGEGKDLTWMRAELEGPKLYFSVVILKLYEF